MFERAKHIEQISRGKHRFLSHGNHHKTIGIQVLAY